MTLLNFINLNLLNQDQFKNGRFFKNENTAL